MKNINRRILITLIYLKQHLLRNPTTLALVILSPSWIFFSYFVYYFEEGAKDSNIKTVADGLWWGIVTMLTVGYGDRYPITLPGRIVGGLAMVSGVIGIAILTAKISSYLLEQALLERRGFVDSKALKDHFIICGWKTEMENFLISILDSNNDLKDKDIVLLNGAPDDWIERLMQTPRLKGVRVVKGDFFSEVSLKKVAPDKAKKVLILADSCPGTNGVIPTATEADSRTVMAAMTLNNIARGVPVAAEVLDSQMEQYLRLAQVNEIVFSRDHSRVLVALAAMGTGVTNIFHDLIDPKSQHFVATEEIPEQFLSKSFGELRNFYLKNHPNMVLIGILENCGNSHVAKDKALRRAQQTPNIEELVKNLQGVKALKFNQPRFCLAESYSISEGSLAIVIENRGQNHGAT